MKNKIYKLKSNIYEDKLFRNIMVVISGSGLAQLVNVISQPLITRIYSPEDYGTLTVFTSLLLILRVATLRYEMAIPIAEDDDEALNLTGLSLLILTISTSVIPIVFFLDEKMFSFFKIQSIESLFFFIPIGVFFQGVVYILTEWMYRKKKFNILSSNTVIRSLSGSISKFLIGTLGFLKYGLIIGHLLSLVFSLYPLLTNFIKSTKEKIRNISLNKMLRVGKRYKDFPIYQMPSSLSLHIRNQLPVVFLGFMFGNDVVGYFGLTNQIIKIPMTLVGQSVMSVFFAEIASIGKNNPTKIKNLSDSIFKKLFILGIIPFLILFLFGPSLFSIIFGEEWREAGIYARILSLYVFSNFVFSPISKVFEVFNKQKEKMIIDFISLFLLIILFIIAAYFGLSQYTVLILYSIMLTLVYWITYILSRKIIDREIELQSTF